MLRRAFITILLGALPTLGLASPAHAAGEPWGHLDAVGRSGDTTVSAGGWAIDPDLGTSSTQVHFYVGTRFVGHADANKFRSDLASVFPQYGGNHAFNVSLDVGAAAGTVCAYAINYPVGQGLPNPQIGCKPYPAAATPTPTPGEVSVRDFGATGDGGDESAAIQRALNSGGKVVTLGSTGSYRASVTVPAGVTFKSTGATLIPATSGQPAVSSGGANAVMQGLIVDARTTAGQTTFRVSHSGVKITEARVTGDGHRYGVLVMNQRVHLSGVTVENSTFDTTSYGILKQMTAVDNAVLSGNTFRNIRRGDAIEFNIGQDTGTKIVNNTVDGVSSDGVVNAGLGIGIAGAGSYDQPIPTMTSGYTISGNTVRNVEHESIHLEVMRDTIIEDNTVEQVTRPRTGVGIVFYGSARIIARGNIVRNHDIGIWDAYGVINDRYVVINGQNVITGNIIEGCRVPIQRPVS